MVNVEVLRKFLNGVVLDDVDWPQTHLNEDMQHQILQNSFHHHVALSMPVSKSYAINFLKILMAKIEESGQEISDETFETYGSVLNQPDDSYFFKHYTIPVGKMAADMDIVSVKETKQLVSGGTTGLRTWQASLYLAEFMLNHVEHLKDQTVLELGCGLGTLGIILTSQVQCKSYLFTDHHEKVLELLDDNLAINKSKLKGVTSTLSLDWDVVKRQGLTPEQIQAVNTVDLILAADVTYDVTILPEFTSTLKAILSHSKPGCTVLISTTIRKEETYTKFKELLNKQKLKFKPVESDAPAVFYYDRTCQMEILEVSLNFEQP